MTVPYTFGTATTSIPLSNLDSNFNTPITLGNTAIYLGNTTTTIGNLTLTNATISSGNVTISNVTVTTANVTNITVSGTTTLSGLTASTALALDASKNVVSVTNTGTSNNVLSASPTLTGTIAGASLSLSSLTSGRVTFAGASGLLSDSANLTFDGTNLILGAANPLFQGSSSTGSAALSNNSAGAFIRVYGGSHATRANFTDFINASSTSTFDSAGNLGLGVTPSASSLGKSMQIGALNGITLFGYSNGCEFGNNFYYNSSYLYGASGYATRYTSGSGIHAWYNAPSGSANAAITFTLAMTLDASGNLGVGTTSPTSFGGFKTLELANSSGNAISLVTGTSVIAQTIASNTNSLVYTGTRSNHSLVITTNDTERMRITSTGTISLSATSNGSADIQVINNTTGLRLVGGTTIGTDSQILLTGSASGLNSNIYFDGADKNFRNTAGSVVQMTLSSSGDLALTGNANPTININGTSGAGARGILFSWNGTQYARITQNPNSGELKIFNGESGQTGYFITFSTDNAERMRITSAGVLDIGTGGGAVGQIQFPATQVASANANTLDDYEEGTWSSAVANDANVTGTGAFDRGEYTKIGRLVTVVGRVTGLSITTVLSTVAVGLTLPFAMYNNTAVIMGPVRASGTNEMIGISLDATGGNATAIDLVLPGAQVTATGSAEFSFSLTYQASA